MYSAFGRHQFLCQPSADADRFDSYLYGHMSADSLEFCLNGVSRVCFPWTALVMLTLTSPAHAGFSSGNDVYQFCSTRRAAVEGFVAGAFDSTEIDNDAINDYLIASFKIIPDPDLSAKTFIALEKSHDQVKHYCEPRGITLIQTTDIFCQFLNAKPAMRHMPAAYLLKQSLAEAWPCPQPEK